MSKIRQQRKPPRSLDDGVSVRTYAVRHQGGFVIPPHVHDWHQLVYATEGAMWVRTAHGDWVAPPNRAVWVPAGVEHSIEMAGTVLVQTLYLTPRAFKKLPTRCTAVNVSPLLRELIRHAISIGVLRRTKADHVRLIAFLVDQLRTLSTIPLQLPSPRDERARQAADYMKTCPTNASMERIAEQASTSVRTLERLFQNETGLTFGKWRQQLRLLQSLQLLAAGRSVVAVASEVGYDSPSAFIAMFKRTLGTTPSRYFLEQT